MMVDHDRLFKELLITFFVEFIELFFADLRGKFERESLVFLDKEVFTDVTAGEKYEADLVVRAKFRGTEGYFLIHIENQSSAHSGFARRMFFYFTRFHEREAVPVYPIAVFSYDAPKRDEAHTYEVGFEDFPVLRFEFRVIQLNQLNWRDFLQSQNPVASALMAKMNIAEADRPRVKYECLRLLATLHLDPARMKLISGFVDTYLKLNTVEQHEFQTLTQQMELSEQEGVMEIVTSWMEEGIQIGLEKGRQEGRRSWMEEGIQIGLERGRQEGRRSWMEEGIQIGLERGRQEGVKEGEQKGRHEALLGFTVRLLTRKFGALDEATQAHLSTLSLEQLETLGDALLDFTTPAELATWLAKRGG